MGIEWKELHGIAGFPWPRWSAPVDGRCGEGYYDLFCKGIDEEELPITLITLTAAEELIVEDGKVRGVVGTCDDGSVYRISSERGVILATGGYSGNPDMLKEYNTYWKWDADTVIPTTNAYGHTGDGITMALAAGAQTAYMEKPMMFPYADQKGYSTETIVGNTGDCLLVNAEGKRFVDESASRFDISAAIMEQTDSKAFLISDATNCLVKDGLGPFGADVEFLLANGQLYRADSIAEQMKMDPAALEETIEKYNGYAEKSVDDDFGRTVFTETAPIKEAPFYSSPRTWAAHITLGGIVVNDDYQALDAAGNPIDGLYYVGELATERSGVASMCTGLYAARVIYGQA